LYILIGLDMQGSSFQEIAPSDFNVKVRTKTDTGGWVEYTKALERTSSVLGKGSSDGLQRIGLGCCRIWNHLGLRIQRTTDKKRKK